MVSQAVIRVVLYGDHAGSCCAGDGLMTGRSAWSWLELRRGHLHVVHLRLAAFALAFVGCRR